MADESKILTGPKSIPSPGVKTGAWISALWRDANPLRVVGGMLLAVLVFAAASSAVIFFAAAQFQSRVADLSLNGAPLTIWRIDAFRTEFDSWTDDIKSMRIAIDKDQRMLVSDKQQMLVMTAAAQSARDRIGDDARSLQSKLAAASTQPTNAATPVASDLADVMDRIGVLLNQEDLQKRFGDEFATLNKRYIEYEDFRATIISNQTRIASNEIAIANAVDQRKARVDSAAKLFSESSTTVTPELVERIINITSELKSLSKVWHSIIYEISLWTNDMLVLMLLISMGILGAALNLLAVFFTNEKESLSFGEYPLRLAFGAVLAIVMFIIAKAGVPILADTSKVGGSAPLNPYFISLLAIVAGLMSDRSMAAVRNVATTLLQSVGGADYTARYTRVVLDEALKTANRDVDGLSRLLGLDAPAIRKLFSGNDSVAPDQQKLIAAYVGQRPRDLFSDLPAG